jgi:hypothetical protein
LQRPQSSMNWQASTAIALGGHLIEIAAKRRGVLINDILRQRPQCVLLETLQGFRTRWPRIFRYFLNFRHLVQLVSGKPQLLACAA